MFLPVFSPLASTVHRRPCSQALEEMLDMSTGLKPERKNRASTVSILFLGLLMMSSFTTCDGGSALKPALYCLEIRLTSLLVMGLTGLGML